MVKIFVGNLGPEATSHELRMLFEKFGKVSECDVKKNYGFVHMPYDEDANAAIEALNEYLLHGCRMKVEKSHGKPGFGMGVRENSSFRRKTVKIFVGNLHQDTKAQELRILFEKFGNVVECDVMKNYGFVHMDDEEDAKAAIEALHEHEIHGANMNVQMSHSKPSRTDSNRSLKTVKLFIGNVSHEATSEDIQGLFEQYGNVVECEKKRNFAFVHLDAIEDALAAMEALHEHEVHGSRIKVEMSKSKPNSFNPAYAQEDGNGGSRWQPVKIFIGNLSPDTTKRELEVVFAKFGTVLESDVIKNYGFVHMESDEDANVAIETLTDCYLHGCKMRVEKSRPKNRDFDHDGRGDGSYDSQDAWGGFSDRGFGRGANRGGRGRFDPYSRSAQIPASAPFPNFGREGFGKQNSDFNSRRAPGYGRSGHVPPPPVESGYDYDGEYERYLRWRDMEWGKFWERRDPQGGSTRDIMGSHYMFGSSSPKGDSGRGYHWKGPGSAFSSNQSSLYTNFD